jgi:hypothetical protein
VHRHTTCAGDDKAGGLGLLLRLESTQLTSNQSEHLPSRLELLIVCKSCPRAQSALGHEVPRPPCGKASDERKNPWGELQRVENLRHPRSGQPVVVRELGTAVNKSVVELTLELLGGLQQSADARATKYVRALSFLVLREVDDEGGGRVQTTGSIGEPLVLARQS